MALCILLLISSIQIFVLGTSSSNGVFSIQPNDVTVEVGGNATFTCRTKKCERIVWIRYSEAEANGTSTSTTIYRETNARQDVVVLLKDCMSTLLLLNVRSKQGGDLRCLHSPKTLYSNRARLTVIQPPTPICTLNPTTPHVNDTVSLVCRVPNNTKIPTLLSWYSARTNAQSTLLAESRVIEPGSTSIVKHRLRGGDNYGRFVCISGWGGSRGPNCSVTPLKVRVGHVTVAVDRKYNSESGMVELHLECRSEAVPEMSHYSWTVQEGTIRLSWNVSDSGFQDVSWNATSRFLRINNCVSFNSLIVTCSASNAVGLNATSEALNITNCKQEDTPGTFTSFDLYIGVILAVFIMIVVSALCLYKIAKHRRQSGTIPIKHQDSTRRESGNSTRLTSRPQRSITISEYMTVGDPRCNPKPPAVPPPPMATSHAVTEPHRTAQQSRDTHAHKESIHALYAKPNKSLESIEMSQYATIIGSKVTHSYAI
ncbi:uncharacterized protein [Asterias amurensis]|uniref:uncharacterized protein n=1 Tax=Asterias amurensis TaxID=7602 RepID=UPI003AB77EF3